MVARKRDKTLKRVTLTLDPDDYAAIDQLAQRSQVSSSWLIRRAVREFLERHAVDERVSPSPLEGGKK
jgi:predicted transcriptional regulator